MSAHSEARILIVDDDEVILALLEHLLRGAGYAQLLSTPDPREVEHLYLAYRPDLVLLDLDLPHVGGAEVVAALRVISRHEPFLPVLVMSGDITPAARLEVLSHGAQGLVEKPFEPAEILLRVQSLLELRFRFREMEEENARLARLLSERDAGLGSERRADAAD